MLKKSIRDLFTGLYKRCDCGCGTLVPVINTKGFFAKYKTTHNPKDISNRRSYSRQNNPFWKGGIKIVNKKYLAILRPNHKYCDLTGYVFQHRYRMELMLGRYLTEKEVIHHIDHNTRNNEESNLMLFASHSEHMSYERTKDMTGRTCIICKSDKTYIDKKGRPIWYGNEIDGWICKYCGWREWYKKKASDK